MAIQAIAERRKMPCGVRDMHRPQVCLNTVACSRMNGFTYCKDQNCMMEKMLLV